MRRQPGQKAVEVVVALACNVCPWLVGGLNVCCLFVVCVCQFVACGLRRQWMAIIALHCRSEWVLHLGMVGFRWPLVDLNLIIQAHSDIDVFSKEERNPRQRNQKQRTNERKKESKASRKETQTQLLYMYEQAVG